MFGTGSVGLSAVMAAKLVGAGTIIAIDLVDSRLALARELGATDTINPSREEVPEAVRRITGVGVDYSFETTASMHVLRQAIDILAPRGTCGFVGGAPKGIEVSIDVEHVMTGGRTIRGIIEGDANPGRLPAAARRPLRQGTLPHRPARHLLPVRGDQPRGRGLPLRQGREADPALRWSAVDPQRPSR